MRCNDGNGRDVVFVSRVVADSMRIEQRLLIAGEGERMFALGDGFCMALFIPP